MVWLLLKKDGKASEKLVTTEDETSNDLSNEMEERQNPASGNYRTQATILTIFAITFFFFGVIWLLMPIDLMMNLHRNAISNELREASENFDEARMKFEILADEIRRMEKESIKKLDQCTKVPIDKRFDCHPGNGASALSCISRGCCWYSLGDEYIEESAKVPLNTPYCYYSHDWSIYKWRNRTQDKEFTGFLEINGRSMYKKDINFVKMSAIQIHEGVLQVKIVDANNKRYEPDIPIRGEDTWTFRGTVQNTSGAQRNGMRDDHQFIFDADESGPGFRVKRIIDNAILFDSIGVGGFIFADQFLQISTLLASKNIYGLGEHRTHFRLDTNWQSLTMFNRDQPPTENANLYGSHPFYLVMEDSGHSHGVLFLNSNAMDVILQPTPALTFRSIGGIFEMYILMGPTPALVVQQYSTIVGKPFMPPYWSLGFHLCKFGYGSLAKTKEVWNRTRSAGIPFDTQWNDLDYMNNNNDFTYNKDKFKDLPAFLQEIAEAGMHYIPLIDAGISASEPNGTYDPFDEGIRRGIFINESNSDSPFAGKVWNLKSTVWPDFTNPRSVDWMNDMMSDMWKMFPYDGAWIDMNEPSNFYNGHIDGCVQNDLDNPPYVPNVSNGVLATKTLCMDARLKLGTHYNAHNTYGTHQAIATNHALKTIRKKRPFIISRSTWVGHGAYAGHWDGDIFSTWHDMKMTVPQLLSFGLFQIPMMGSDICGFNGNTTEALCNRWMQLGAFYPFSRNHNTNDAIDQDPVAMGEQVVKSSRKALMIRYRFLPYLYTLFFRAHAYGETVARPLFFEFSNDHETYGVDSQFLWGRSLMIVPVFEEGATKVTAYLPKDIWYDFYDKKVIVSQGENYTLDAPLDTIPLLIRGGSILPAQTPGTTTTASRKNKFELLIAPDVTGSAVGELYWDDGEKLDTSQRSHRLVFYLVDKELVCRSELPPQIGKYSSENMLLGKVQVMGISYNVTKVMLNNKEIPFEYDAARSYLTIRNLSVDLRENFFFTWE